MAWFKTMGSMLILISLATLGIGLRADPPDPLLQAIINNIFNPVKQHVEADQATRKFIATTQGSIVIANESDKPWTFALAPPAAGANGAGAVTVKELRNDRQSFYTPVTLKPGGVDPHPIRARFGTLVISPVPDSSWFSGRKPFAMLCYLEDEHQQRLYFNLVQGAGDKQPSFGLAQASANALLDGIIELSYLELNNMFAIRKGGVEQVSRVRQSRPD